MCEKCWSDAYLRSLFVPTKSQVEHYHDLLKEREDRPCTEAEQRGDDTTVDESSVDSGVTE